MKLTKSQPPRARMALVVLAVFVASCSRDGLKPYPVRGVVKINGEPAVGVTVAFYSTTDFGKTIIPMGQTDAEGRFALMTFAPKDGAPPGDYEVTLVWQEYRKGTHAGPDRLKGTFADPKKSGLKAHVEAKANELPPFDLTAELAPPTEQRKPGRKKER